MATSSDSRQKAPAVAAIEFALATDEGLAFLNCWLHGDFDSIRREGPDCPHAVFDGAEVVSSVTTPP